MKQDNQLRIAKELIELWSGKEPLHNHLTNEFRKHKQFGSRDRRLYSSLAYSLFRIGALAKDLPIEKRLAVASFLCKDDDNKIRNFIVDKFLPEANDLLEADLSTRMSFVDQNIDKTEKLFVSDFVFSDGVSQTDLSKAMLERPLVFIRIKEGKAEDVDQELSQLYIDIEGMEMPANTRALKPGARLDDSFAVNKALIEIQDLSSQMTADHINPKRHDSCWDACCGAGGKSLMLLEKFPKLNIIATDIRKSIIQNYTKRMLKHGYSNFKTLELDLELGAVKVPDSDFIIADVPCSGSGTWARTPEQAFVFTKTDLDQYVIKQENILKNIISSSKKGQTLYYITCSVFKAENEDQVDKLVKAGLVNLTDQHLLNGSGFGADSMFIAELEII